MSYHTAATHDDASKFRKRMQERMREAEKRRQRDKAEAAKPPLVGITMLVPKARAK